MKNVIGFIALITVLSGCGRGVETWTCTDAIWDDPFTMEVTIDFENKTIKDGLSGIRAFNKNENKISWVHESPFKVFKGEKYQRTLDIETGEYTSTGITTFTPETLERICSKQ